MDTLFEAFYIVRLEDVSSGGEHKAADGADEKDEKGEKGEKDGAATPLPPIAVVAVEPAPVPGPSADGPAPPAGHRWPFPDAAF